MRGMRNRIAHGYFDINLDVVWDTVKTALPELLKQLPAVRQVADTEDRNGDGAARGPRWVGCRRVADGLKGRGPKRISDFRPVDDLVVVGARGFEPPTPWSRTRCATRLRYAPRRRVFIGAPCACQRLFAAARPRRG